MTATKSETPIKLAIGQQVETRCGRIGVVQANLRAIGNNAHKYRVDFPGRSVTYTEDGRYLDGDEESHLDIVRIVTPADPAPEAESEAAKANELAIDVRSACGRLYLNFDGIALAMEGDSCREAKIAKRFGPLWSKESLEFAADLMRAWIRNTTQPAPEAEKPAATGKVDVGEGWRLLSPCEPLQEGDETATKHGYSGREWEWTETVRWATHLPQSDKMYYRRRTPTPAPQVDIVRHEVEQLRKANAELLEQNAKLEDELSLAVMQRSNAIDAIKESIIERDRLNGLLNNERNAYAFLKTQLAAVTKERDKLFNKHQDESGIVDRWIEATGCPDPTTYKARTQQPPAAPVEEWRDAEQRDCGRGDIQVSDDGIVYSIGNRFLLSIETIDGERRYLIRSNKQKHHGMQCHFYAYKFARVRKTT